MRTSRAAMALAYTFWLVVAASVVTLVVGGLVYSDDLPPRSTGGGYCGDPGACLRSHPDYPDPSDDYIIIER